ncbi:MAG: hypothetical protein PHT33_10530 [bacterium]|nr:hypothetical protein [bacterium]
MLLHYDEKSNAFILQKEDLSVLEWEVALEADGVERLGSPCLINENICSTTYKIDYGEAGLEWVLDFNTGLDDKIEITSVIRNIGVKPVSLGKAYICKAIDISGFGQPEEDIVQLMVPLGQHLRDVQAVKSPDSCRESGVKILLYNRDRQEAALVGFSSFQRALTRVVYEYDDQVGIKNLAAYSDFAGFDLLPGGTTETEKFVFACGADPYHLLEDWADSVAAVYHPRFIRQPALGWGGGAWVRGNAGESTEEIAVGNVEAINKRLNGFGFEYCWISIANLEGGNPGDWLSWNRGNLPSGSEKLIEELSLRGFKLGLWCGPFYVSSALESLVEELKAKDALLKGTDGELLVVRPKWAHGDAGKLPPERRPKLYALDPSHPDNLKFILKVFKAYRKWGVRYYMLDFLEAGAGNISRFPYPEHYDRSKIAGPEVYTTFLQEIRQAAGEDTFILGSTGPTVHNVGLMDAIRTGNDFGEGRPINPNSFFYPASYVINNMEFWTGAQWALANQASSYYTHGKLYQNDAGNVLTVDKPIPLSQARINATIHALTGSSSMLGDDIRHISEGRLELIKKTLPRSPIAAFPVDLFDRCNGTCPSVFHRKIDMPWGSYDVVASYNFSRQPKELKLDLGRLKLDPDKQYLVWEFWNEEYVGRISGALQLHLPPLTVQVYRLTEYVGHPVVLATDMHLLMGEMELPQVNWDKQNIVLSGRAVRPAGEEGSIFIHAPDNLCVRNTGDCYISKDARDNTLVIRVKLDFTSGDGNWRIAFEPLSEVLDMNKLDLA